MFMVVADVRTLQKNNMVNVVGHFSFPASLTSFLLMK